MAEQLAPCSNLQRLIGPNCSQPPEASWRSLPAPAASTPLNQLQRLIGPSCSAARQLAIAACAQLLSTPLNQLAKAEPPQLDSPCRRPTA